MTIDNVQNISPRVQYVAAAAQTVFPYPFPIFENADLVVVVNGVPTGAFNATGAGNDNGGNVTLTTPSTLNDVVTIYRNIPIARSTNFQQNGPLTSASFNDELDRIVAIEQQLAENLGRAIQLPITNAGSPITTLTPANYAGKYLSFDTNGNPIPAVLTSSGTLTAAIIAALLNATTDAVLTSTQALLQTTAEIAASISPSVLHFDEGDIRRYGATTGSSNNSVAINRALAVSAAGGKEAFLPAGTWNCTSTLIAPLASSMRGTGLYSTLLMTGCDGITFGIPTAYAGSRFFRDFQLKGSSATASSWNGFVCDIGTSVVNAKVIGVKFHNVTVMNFQKGVYVNGPYGLWNASFDDCFLFNNYHGYYFNGQAVGVHIRGGMCQGGAGMTGAGARYGLFAQDSAGGNMQSLHLQGAMFYNYDYLVSLTNVVEVQIENCDLSLYNVAGVNIGGAQGAMVVRDCWIQAAAGVNNHVGVYIVDLGTALTDKITIDSNNIYGNTGTGSCGVYVGVNRGSVTVTNNTIGSAVSSAPFVVGIGGQSPGTLGASATGGGGVINNGAWIEGNTIYTPSGTNIILYSGATNIKCGPNTSQSGTALAFSVPTTTPPGLMLTAPNMRGTATFVAATSIAVTGLAMPNAKYFVSLSGNAAGYTWITSKTATGFTVNCSVSNSNATDWAIGY